LCCRWRIQFQLQCRSVIDSVFSKGWREWLWSFAPLFIWIAVILFLSSSFGSSSHTSMLIRPILNFLFPNAPEETLKLYHAYIRKAAHFTEYAVLGALAFRSFTRLFNGPIYIWAFLLVMTVAIIDEFNQSFNAARTGSPYDVLIDCAGGIFAITVICLFIRRYSARPQPSTSS